MRFTQIDLSRRELLATHVPWQGPPSGTLCPQDASFGFLPDVLSTRSHTSSSRALTDELPFRFLRLCGWLESLKLRSRSRFPNCISNSRIVRFSCTEKPNAPLRRLRAPHLQLPPGVQMGSCGRYQ